DLVSQGLVPGTAAEAEKKYLKAVVKGLVKVISKMGISTIQSYHGAQVFEAVGLSQDFVDEYFTWTSSRVSGIGIDVVANEARMRHERGFPPKRPIVATSLPAGGEYQYRTGGEFHISNPETIHKLQYACRTNSYKAFQEYSAMVDDHAKQLCTLQIKTPQGAKPGEGGQLPGGKVYPWIATVRHATPGVGLISPPPHHDIYSIEDLAELIHDLKNSNKDARISVKLVSELGVGTIAAGVAKAHADVVLISGYDGGTGASPLTSIKHAGIPWELGL